MNRFERGKGRRLLAGVAGAALLLAACQEDGSGGSLPGWKRSLQKSCTGDCSEWFRIAPPATIWVFRGSGTMPTATFGYNNCSIGRAPGAMCKTDEGTAEAREEIWFKDGADLIQVVGIGMQHFEFLSIANQVPLNV